VTACTLKRLGHSIQEIAEMLSPGSSHPMAETAMRILRSQIKQVPQVRQPEFALDRVRRS
jgi:DNA-binding transcriptional MerR regulator